jgi:hypothetical protein
VRLGLVPHFALGPIANVSSPASASGDSLVLGMNDVDGGFDVRRPETNDAGIASPSWRVRYGILRDCIYAVSGHIPVSTPSSFLALTIVWPTRGR